METSKDNPKPPESLDLVAAMQIDVAAADAGGGKPALPRFTMVAYAVAPGDAAVLPDAGAGRLEEDGRPGGPRGGARGRRAGTGDRDRQGQGRSSHA